MYVLALLFLGSWIGQFFSQLASFRNEQQTLGEEFAWSDYIAAFSASTFENWQSEWLQLIFQAVLLLAAKHWIFQADAEDLERIERKIDDIHDHVGAGAVQEPAKGDDEAIDPEPD